MTDDKAAYPVEQQPASPDVDGSVVPETPAPAAPQARPQAYVRPRTPHKTQPPVNDIQADEKVEHNYSHDSSYTLSSRSPITSRTYRKSRSQVSHVKKSLKYGQYLSVPKGSREIFGSREQLRKKHLLVALIIVLAIAAVALIVMFMPK